MLVAEWNLALSTLEWYARTPPKAPASAELADRELCTARALPMIGQRPARTCKLDMRLPPRDALCAAVAAAVVERLRSVAGLVFFRKGHMARD